MNDKEIIDTLACINYTWLSIKAAGKHNQFGPGEDQWRVQLRQATTEQRLKIEEKVQQIQKRLSA